MLFMENCFLSGIIFDNSRWSAETGSAHHLYSFSVPRQFWKGCKMSFIFFNVNLQNSSGAYNPEVSLTATNTDFFFLSKQKQPEKKNWFTSRRKSLSADLFYILSIFFLIFCFQSHEVLRAKFWRDGRLPYNMRKLGESRPSLHSAMSCEVCCIFRACA